MPKTRGAAKKNTKEEVDEEEIEEKETTKKQTKPKKATGKRKAASKEEESDGEEETTTTSSSTTEPKPKKQKTTADGERKSVVVKSSDVVNSVSLGAPLKDVAAYEARIKEIAEFLLNKAEMIIAGKAHKFVEIEFYVNDSIHADPFAHCDSDQKLSGVWYFHRQNGKGFKGGSYKGLDVAIGNSTAFGGVLIRAIKDVSSGEVQEGPSLVVDRILALTKKSSVQELVDSIDTTINKENDDDLLYVQTAKSPTSLTLVTSGRVGLTLKQTTNPEERKHYIMKPYRFTTQPESLSKGKNYLVSSLLGQGKSEAEVVKICKATAASVSKLNAAFIKGKTKTLKSFEGAALGNEDVCELYGAWLASQSK